MQIITLQQGTPDWHQHRATALNASDAPAMLGISPYKSRADLVQERATGVTPEVTQAQQRIFDRGHAIEALARPLAEAILGDDLSPCVGVLDSYSASFDGITFDGDTAWECKTLNEGLRQAMPHTGHVHDSSHGAALPEHYRAQMEHQAMVSGCKRILFTAASMGEDGELDDVRHCWYEPNPVMRTRLVAGWEQLMQDVATWQPTEQAAPVVATPVESLPAVVVQVQGVLTVGGNLPAFGAALRTFIERIPAKPSTDQEFADAEAACKALKKAEEALESAEGQALAQIDDVEIMRRTVADLRAMARTTRLATEKLVKAEKDARRSEKVMAARAAFGVHVQRLQQDCKGVVLNVPMPDFATAIKGLSSLASIDQKLTAALLEGQANANIVAGRVTNNLKLLDSVPEYASLFPDRQELSHKDSEVLELLMHKRVADHQAAQAQRLEAERERIRKEEADRADREARAKLEADARAAQEAIAQASQQSQISQPVAADLSGLVAERHAEGLAQQVIQQAASAPSNDGASINLGAINEHLAPIKLDAAGLAALGFEPVAIVKASKLYRASDLRAIRAALIEHLASLNALEIA